MSWHSRVARRRHGSEWRLHAFVARRLVHGGSGRDIQHFLRDIGLIFLLLGGAFLVGAAQPHLRVALWAAASIWLTGHALFHFWEVAVGICSPSVLPRDFPAVTLPAIIGIALTFWAIHQSRGRGAKAV
jgi:hypothetical protein